MVLRWHVLTIVSLVACLLQAYSNAPATTGVLSGSVGGKRTLVLLDAISIMFTHSEFFRSLEQRGHKLTYHLSDSKDVVLSQYGDYNYDNLVMFAPTAALKAGVTVIDVMDFVEQGGNLIVAASEEVGESVRHIAALGGVELDPNGTVVIDHFNFDASLDSPEAPHQAITSTGATVNKHFLGSAAGSSTPILFKGIGQSIQSDNILAAPVLSTSSTAYSANAEKGPIKPNRAGQSVVLVTAVQARNNARIVVSGSLDLFSNRFFTAPGSGNAAFCAELSKWALAERGVLRVSNVAHSRKDGTAAELLLKQKERQDLPASLFPEPEIAKNSQVYRIKTDITYSLLMEEYDADKGGWNPYIANDVQLEAIMLDPYERLTLTPSSTGVFSTTFKAPDTYGIFKFRVMYRRHGLTVLQVSTQVSLRPFSHIEYDRFISCAFPYYAGVFSLVGGFFVFAVFFLLASDEKTERRKATKGD